jgi:DNA-binding CsgD family transcriptional regulator
MSPTLRIILVYGVVIGVVLSVLRVLELLYLTGRLNLDLYVGAVALIFLSGGLHVGTTWQRTRVFRASARADFETNGLSPRELQVLEHIAEGASNREIAVGLHVSTNTVKTHINHLYAKIGVNRRTQAVARARSLGLI